MTQEERILQRATEDFLMYGIRSVSMDDIATNLGMSKKTIYKYFKDKKAIVHEVTKNLIGSAESLCKERCDDSISAIDELLKLIGFINTFFTNMNATAMYDLEKYYPQSFVLFQEHQKVFMHDMLVNNLKRGIEEDVYRKDIDVEITARLRMGQIRLAFNPEYFPSNKFSLKQIQLASLDLYIMGITTCNGREIVEKYKATYEY